MSDKHDEERMLAREIGRQLSEKEIEAVSGGSWSSSIDGNWKLDSAEDALQ
jgi:hypothetical protein